MGAKLNPFPWDLKIETDLITPLLGMGAKFFPWQTISMMQL